MYCIRNFSALNLTVSLLQDGRLLALICQNKDAVCPWLPRRHGEDWRLAAQSTLDRPEPSSKRLIHALSVIKYYSRIAQMYEIHLVLKSRRNKREGRLKPKELHDNNV